jgi:hypothetical protein
MIVRVEPARPDHIPAVLANLRPWEKDRIAAVEHPEKILADQISRSTMAFAGLFDDEVAWLWGLETRTVLNDVVHVWLITTRAIEEHPVTFLRHLRRIAELILVEHGTIEAELFADNALPAKWLKWLGAELAPSSQSGILDVTLRRDGWASKQP